MSQSLDAAISKIRSVGENYCENQMYVWPGFDPLDPDPAAFFRDQGIEFDGDLFIRYRVKRTFVPIPSDRIEAEERMLGASLPQDYKSLLQVFGEFHLPGRADICIESPVSALETTQQLWCYKEGQPLRVLAISPYNVTSDGNSIGFVRDGNSFHDAVFEFNHELGHKGDDPSLWSTKISSCFADFVIDYLECVA